MRFSYTNIFLQNFTLQTHPKVNLKLHNQFENIHSSWLHENTTRDQCHQTEEWLLGKGTSSATENFLPCLTTKDSGRVGGMTVNRYSVVYTKDLNKVPSVTSPKPPSWFLFYFLKTLCFGACFSFLFCVNICVTKTR